VAECDHCGEHNLDSSRFCSACGTALPRRVHEGLEVRKTVTILFCDVVGSTSLGEATDPETTRRVMARYAESMREVIEHHGGTVERFRGDEVMAVFGIPVAHEDDALRAVRAATAMQRRLAQLNAELRATWGVELACRIGVNTGEVVAGDPGTGETFVTGDAVNLAKRLEQAAEPGTILIGTATYPLVKDAVTVGPRERFSAKGKSEPVARFRVDEVDEDAAGYERRLDAPLVNRVDELATLRPLVSDAFTERRCRIVTVLGLQGSESPGWRASSRQSSATSPTSRPDAAFPTAAGSPSGRYSSSSPIWAASPRPRPPRRDARRAGRARAAPYGHDGGRRRSAEHGGVLGVRRFLERISERRPLLVVFEDLHWAEPTMLDLVEYLAAFASGPLVLLCIARPELLETRPGLASAMLQLEQLSETETAELVEALGVGDAELQQRITSTSEGNPLFAEQLAAMTADAGPATRSSSLLPSMHCWPPGSTASRPPSGGRSSGPRSSARSSGRAPSSAFRRARTSRS
jgi:class 3 adenylate cyclase